MPSGDKGEGLRSGVTRGSDKAIGQVEENTAGKIGHKEDASARLGVGYVRIETEEHGMKLSGKHNLTRAPEINLLYLHAGQKTAETPGKWVVDSMRTARSQARKRSVVCFCMLLNRLSIVDFLPSPRLRQTFRNAWPQAAPPACHLFVPLILTTMSDHEANNPEVLLQKKPRKSILKKHSSDDLGAAITRAAEAEAAADAEAPPVHKTSKSLHFDEMNIIATYHPEDKDYGHMKIDEPKTPYSGMSDVEEHNLMNDANHEKLAKGIKATITRSRTPTFSGDDVSEDELTEEGKQKKKKFLEARKKHYGNEATALHKSATPSDEED
uniref:Protein phosphatase inhibitor 2 n=1 Tax=Panagrellus redivivus TaxID=6233 RepID=A0A7E4W0R3_PANRE